MLRACMMYIAKSPPQSCPARSVDAYATPAAMTTAARTALLRPDMRPAAEWLMVGDRTRIGAGRP